MDKSSGQMNSMTPLERRATHSVASIYFIRMLGLFMILPVFVLYADQLQGVTPLLVGVAIGIYGLTQALMQIPFGMMSDRYGRKPILILGLLIFALGSIVAATSGSIYGVIIGRALQGSGAIAAVLMALTADLTREEQRFKAMAVIGITIGFSFTVALILGPLLYQWIGVTGIFWLTALLALGGIVLLKVWVPDPEQTRFHRDTEPVPAHFSSVLRDRQLLRLDFGVLVLHMILTASFVVLPLALRDHAGLDTMRHWHIYLPVVLASAVAMIPFILIAERWGKMKQVFVSAILVIGLSELALVWFFSSLIALALILVAFFTALNILEAGLPSLVTRMSPPDRKGTAMGIFSSSQFFGAFLGGVTGGWLYGSFGIASVFVFCSIMAGMWFLVAVSMQRPRFLSSHMINIGNIDASNAQQLEVRLTQVAGVAEVVVIPEDGIAYLKVDLRVLDREKLGEFSCNRSAHS